MTTTYVFGAGASRDVGYPLASEMGDGLLDFMLKSEDVPETRMEFQPASRRGMCVEFPRETYLLSTP